MQERSRSSSVRAFRASACISLQGEKSACASALFSPLRLIRDCLLVTADNRIICLEPYTPKAVPIGVTVHDLGDVIITPPVINAHTHIQLSHMAQKTCRGQGFVPWLQSLIALLSLPLEAHSIEQTVQSMYDAGTGHFADYTHAGLALVARAAASRGMSATFLAEWFGFADRFTDVEPLPPRSHAAHDTLSTTQRKHLIPCAHALYSTDAHTVQGVHRWCTAHKKAFALHLAESADETEALTEGTGALVDLYRPVVLPQTWKAPAMSPIEYAQHLGILQHNTLAIHCVHTTKKEQALLAHQGVSVCLCPRSNQYIGVGMPPIHEYTQLPINLCLGTDGLSSNDDVNVWHEAQFLHEHHSLPWNALLRMLTVNAAKALCLPRFKDRAGDGAGTLFVGARARWAIFPFHTAAFFHETPCF